jgi:hypothetical protein
MSLAVSERLDDFQVEVLTQSFCDEVVGKDVYDLVKFRKIFENPRLSAGKFQNILRDSEYRHNAAYIFFLGRKDKKSIVSTLKKKVLMAICRLADPMHRSQLSLNRYFLDDFNLISQFNYYLYCLGEKHTLTADRYRRDINNSLSRAEDMQRKQKLENINRMDINNPLDKAEDIQRKQKLEKIGRINLIFLSAIISSAAVLSVSGVLDV